MRVFVCIVVGLCGCTELDLDRTLFACRADDECARGTICDSLQGLCVRPDQLLDGGPPPDAGELVDAGPPPPPPHEPVCFPELSATTTATEHWWCRRMWGAELRTFTERVGAKVLDVELEPDAVGERTYSAALERKATGRRAAFVYEAEPANELEAGMRVIDRSVRSTGISGEYLVAASYEFGFGSRYYDLGYTTDRLASGIADLLVRERWTGAYGGRVLDLDRWIRDGTEVYAWTLRIRGVDRATQLHFFSGRDEIEALTSTAKVLDVEDEAVLGRYTVVTAPRAVTDPEAHFVDQLTAAQLDAAVADGVFHVERVVPVSLGRELRWSALLVRTPTTTAARVAADLGDGTSGTVGLLLTSSVGAALRGVQIDTQYRAVPNTLIAWLTLDRVQARLTTLDTEIPNYPAAAGVCPPVTSTGTITVRAALAGVLREGEFGSLKSLTRQLDARALPSLLARMGLTETMLRGTPGCADDANTSSLRDQGRIMSALAAHPQASVVRELMLGSSETDGGTLDPWDGPTVLDEMVSEESRRLAIPSAVSDPYRAALWVRYAHALVPGARPSGTVAAMAEVPRCVGAARADQRVVYALHVREGSVMPDVTRALAVARAELLRDLLRAGLTSAADCFR